MNKSILLINTPKDCVRCKLSIAHDLSFTSEQTMYICSVTGQDTGCRTDGWADEKIFKADWCPLKPVPKKQMKRGVADDCYKDGLKHGFVDGWNAYFDKIINI